MRTKPLLATAAAVLALAATACGNSGRAAPTSSTSAVASTGPDHPANASTTPPGTTAAPVPTSAAAVDPNAPEVVEPGDIPDNQVFVAFASPDGTYSLKVPEGWARTEKAGVVTFTDNYNSVTAQSVAASAAPSVDSVRAGGLADVSSDPTFTLIDVKPVTRRAGTGVLATYEIGSSPNPVTGKKALLAVERYVFFHNGNEVVLNLSGAKGADNVDPWKIVSNSLAWT
jgi:hypothetical protein